MIDCVRNLHTDPDGIASTVDASIDLLDRGIQNRQAVGDGKTVHVRVHSADVLLVQGGVHEEGIAGLNVGN